MQHDDKDEIDATSVHIIYCHGLLIGIHSLQFFHMQIPRALCTMDFAPKITESMSASGDSTAGFAPAALPYKSRLWRKKVLKIQLNNRHFIHGWNITLSKFMECANRWSDGMVSTGSNHIPRFESDDENPDIIVELNSKYLAIYNGLDEYQLYFISKRTKKINLLLAMLKMKAPLRCTLTSVFQTRHTKST